MNESLSNDFLNMDVKDHWSADPRLESLADYLDQILDPHIKMFTKFLLVNSDTLWDVPVDDTNRQSYPPDEYKAGGLLRNTRRSVRSFIYLSSCMNFSADEKDCAIAALLLRNATKALRTGPAKQDIMYDPFYLYTIDAYIETSLVRAQEGQVDTGSFLEVGEASVAMITRLIHTSDGAYSILPETYPKTALEKTVHMAILMGGLCYDVLNGERPRVAK